MIKDLRVLTKLLILSLFITSVVMGDSNTIVAQYNNKNVLTIGNAAEPAGIDPQNVSGVIENNVIRSMFEGLCAEHPSKEGVHAPAAAASWNANEDFTQWTFNLQPNGKWSDGKPITAEDFRFSFNRLLHPRFSAKYASMLYFIKGAEKYNKNHRTEILLANHPDWETFKAQPLRKDDSAESKDIRKSLSKRFFKNLDLKQKAQLVNSLGLDELNKEQLTFIQQHSKLFNWKNNISNSAKSHLISTLLNNADTDLWHKANIGVHTPNSHTLIISLKASTPFLPDLTKHFTWYPVPKHIILKHGEIYKKNTEWTKKINIVGNGPFKMKDRRLDFFIEVERNPNYWDAKTVKLNGIRFLPTENAYTEARMAFRDQLHITHTLAPELIEYAKKHHPNKVRQETYLGCNFLRFNVTNKFLKNKDLRKAFAYSIDAQKIIDNIRKGGEKRATGIVPPMGEYKPSTQCKFDITLANEHLKKSGIAPQDVDLVLLTTSKDQSKILAEAYQDMWKKHLGIHVRIEQREWKAYLTRLKALDYGIGTGGWIGDYPDPTTFLDIWKKGDGSNRTGWSSKEYENILKQAETQKNPVARIRLLEKAEQLFLNDAAIAPIFWYNTNYLIHESVKGWHPLLLNNHPYKHVSLKP